MLEPLTVDHLLTGPQWAFVILIQMLSLTLPSQPSYEEWKMQLLMFFCVFIKLLCVSDSQGQADPVVLALNSHLDLKERLERQHHQHGQLNLCKAWPVTCSSQVRTINKYMLLNLNNRMVHMSQLKIHVVFTKRNSSNSRKLKQFEWIKVNFY